jgi:rubrerythrin
VPIDTVEDLREHLQLAIEIELTTIPPYLYAMYSILDETSEATKLIRSVAAEEMLHATLMANLLLAVGGEPRFYDAEVIPSFPTPLPHHQPELIVRLEPYSRDVVERTFLSIERPGRPGAPAEPDEWESQGQLYHALEQAIMRLDAEEDLFGNLQRERQLHDPHGYAVVKYDSAASGGLNVIENVQDAVAAMEVAIHQGEGLSDDRYADPAHTELTHYAKFLLLDDGIAEVAGVHPAVMNPTIETLPAEVQPVAELANALYSYVFLVLDRVLAPDTQDRHHLVGLIYGTMVALLAPVARYLMTMPLADGSVAGPPFAYHGFRDMRRAEAELRALARPIAREHPALRPALAQLDRLPQ